MSTRTVEDEKNYQDIKKQLQSKLGFCPFHDDEEKVVIEHYNYWKLLNNDYPYQWTQEHYLLFTKRHTNKLNEQEQEELNKILIDMDKEHYVCLKNPDVLTSVWCYHYHIIKPYIPTK